MKSIFYCSELSEFAKMFKVVKSNYNCIVSRYKLGVLDLVKIKRASLRLSTKGLTITDYTINYDGKHENHH